MLRHTSNTLNLVLSKTVMYSTNSLNQLISIAKLHKVFNLKIILAKSVVHWQRRGM
jgi:hypothetical protein